MIHVLIADDHPVYREGLRRVIEASHDVQVTHEASDGLAALRLIKDAAPAVAILDMNMPGMDGLAVARQARLANCKTRIVFVTMYQEEDLFNEAMDVGALGYVLKESAMSDILASIRAVAQGQHYLSPGISDFLLRRLSDRKDFEARHAGLNKLTPAERRILKLIAENRTSKEIAAELGLSARTIENHRANICTKLSLHGIHSLVRFAFENRSRL